MKKLCVGVPVYIIKHISDSSSSRQMMDKRRYTDRFFTLASSREDGAITVRINALPT